MAKVILHRKGGFCDRWRAYTIVVDDVERGRIKRNTSVSLDLSPGPHEITARIDWCSGNVLCLDIAADETVEIDISNPHSPWRLSEIISQAPDTYLLLGLRSAGP